MIKSVNVSATLASESDWDHEPDLNNGAWTFVENQLPLLAGCLSNHVDRLDLTFSRELKPPQQLWQHDAGLGSAIIAVVFSPDESLM